MLIYFSEDEDRNSNAFSIIFPWPEMNRSSKDVKQYMC